MNKKELEKLIDLINEFAKENTLTKKQNTILNEFIGWVSIEKTEK